MSVRAQLSQAFSARGALDFANSEDRDTGKLLPRRAKQYGTVALEYRQGPFTVLSELLATSHRFDGLANTQAQRMGGYAIANLGVTYRVTREWSVLARWNNLFNKTYELAQNFATPGSNIFVGMRYQ